MAAHVLTRLGTTLSRLIALISEEKRRDSSAPAAFNCVSFFVASQADHSRIRPDPSYLRVSGEAFKV